ncbi:hypothetical protein DITRI_Ditri09bG0123300 [Diplodiscus trichospermus]
MNQRLRSAAQSGNIDALYAVIKDDSDVFRRIDQMEFVDTPLHTAAAAGHTDFAMEMMNLKPSFARKLNQDGFSPIHLALQNQHKEMVLDLLSADKDVVRVKGREGYTPLHYVACEGNIPLLSQFLDDCPDCILDLTIRKETALHIAAQNSRLEAFKAILQRIQETLNDDPFQRRKILNLQDKNGNTVLHVAASNNQHQMIKLLTNCKEVDKNKVNQRGFTALDVLQRQTLVDSKESVKILNSRASLRFFKVPRSKINLANYIRKMKPDTMNALLVVFSLVLTMTYQVVLNPPGGVYQVDADPAPDPAPAAPAPAPAAPASAPNNGHAGKSVVNEFNFLLFYIPNGVAFITAWVMTMVLLEFVAKTMKPFLYSFYLSICFCYGAAISIIAPTIATGFAATGSAFIIVTFLYFITICFYK